jgi:transposase
VTYALSLAPLPPGVRAEVRDCFEQAPDPETRTRCQMVLLATERGLRTVQIAVLVFRSHDTVWRVLCRFQKNGLAAIARRHGGGPPPLLTSEAEAELSRVVADDSHTHGVASANWTTALLATYLGQKLGIAVDSETVRRALRRLGYVYKRPTWTVQHNAQEREDWTGNACG